MIVPATMKPCPFCGGEAKFTDGGPGRGFVHCGACSASCDDGSREYAVNAWNKRATDTIVPADVAELVIAARIVAFEDQSPEALRALDKASEAFAERVPWENDPDEEQANARAADIALTVTPPPSPDVAGVKLADRVDLTGGVRPAHVLESLTESVNQAWAIIGDNARCSVPATFIGWLLQEYESLSAEKGRLVDLVKDLDDALCAAQEKLQGNPLVLKWVIEIIGDARDSARTALTPKEKA